MASDFNQLVAYREQWRSGMSCIGLVKGWSDFDRNTVGVQMIRAIDSVGANIAEAMGRWSKADRRRCLLIARGSLYETEHWVNTATTPWTDPQRDFSGQLAEAGRTLNGLVDRRACNCESADLQICGPLPICGLRTADSDNRPGTKLPAVQERALTERLITYDTATTDGINAAAGFIKGWLEAREIDVKDGTHNGVPVLAATVGPEARPDPRPPRPHRRGAGPTRAIRPANQKATSSSAAAPTT